MMVTTLSWVLLAQLSSFGFLTARGSSFPRSAAPTTASPIAPPAHVSQDDEVDRLIALGGTRIDIGQGDVSWVVMADPDNNEFCVLTPR